MKILICSFIMFLVLCIPVMAGVSMYTKTVNGGIIYCFVTPNAEGNTISCVFVPNKDACRK